MISDSLKLKIKEHALKEAPKECCGFLLLREDEIDTFPCLNSARNAEDEYLISPKEYLKASFSGKIIGIYHSHGKQENSFSDLDQQVAKQLKLNNIVYIVKKDEFYEYSPSDSYNPYVGREFQIGKSDCLSLIEDYYKEQLGKNLFHYERKEGWDINYKEFIENKLISLGLDKNFDEFIKRENLKKVETPEKNDIIVFKYLKNYPSHFGIYIGADYILHQPRNKKSVIEKMTSAEKRRIYCYLRPC